MNQKSLLISLVWAAVLAFFGYLLVSAIPLVAPSANKDIVVSFLENGRLAIVAFFGFLGGLVGVMQTLGVKVTDVDEEKDVAPSQDVADGTIERYKAKLKEAFSAVERLKRMAENNRHVAIKAMSYRLAMVVAAQFAFCHIASAGIQGVLQKAYPLDTLTGTLFTLVAFAQTELLLIFAFIVPYRQHSSFLKDTKYSSQARSGATVFRIGALGVFLCGLVSLVTLSPEQISTLLGNESLRTMPVLNMNYLAFLAFTRLFLCPAIGLVGSLLAVRFNSK